MNTARHTAICLCVIAGTIFVPAVVLGQSKPTATAAGGKGRLSPAVRKQGEAAISKALAYLRAVQGADGAWQAFGQPDPAITALAGKAFAQDPAYGPRHPIVRKALAYVLSHRRADGGIYPEGSLLRNYYTSVALMFLSAELGSADVADAVADAQKFLKRLQWAEHRKDASGRPITPDHVWYGGAGYGKHKRPDLSNTQMMLEALKQSGLPPSDPVYRKALRFISRCQMLSHTNDQPFAAGAADGGFIYTAANNGESKAGYATVAGRRMLRSYGSMTYAGFKSMLYAKVARDDPRIKAAFVWIRKHYTLDENPNMPGAQRKEGLFYYYHLFAKALAAWGEDYIVDAAGRRHNWRADLINKLLSLQRDDGSWINEADRWYEGNPHYVTAMAVLALQTALN